MIRHKYAYRLSPKWHLHCCQNGFNLQNCKTSEADMRYAIAVPEFMNDFIYFGFGDML